MKETKAKSLYSGLLIKLWVMVWGLVEKRRVERNKDK
jgi:hypothetical protein